MVASHCSVIQKCGKSIRSITCIMISHKIVQQGIQSAKNWNFGTTQADKNFYSAPIPPSSSLYARDWKGGFREIEWFLQRRDRYVWGLVDCFLLKFLSPSSSCQKRSLYIFILGYLGFLRKTLCLKGVGPSYDLKGLLSN